MWGSEVSYYMTEIHTAKYTKRGDMAIQCRHYGARGGEVQIVGVLKGTLDDALTLNYVTSLVLLRLS